MVSTSLLALVLAGILAVPVGAAGQSWTDQGDRGWSGAAPPASAYDERGYGERGYGERGYGERGGDDYRRGDRSRNGRDGPVRSEEDDRGGRYDDRPTRPATREEPRGGLDGYGSGYGDERRRPWRGDYGDGPWQPGMPADESIFPDEEDFESLPRRQHRYRPPLPPRAPDRPPPVPYGNGGDSYGRGYEARPPDSLPGSWGWPRAWGDPYEGYGSGWVP